MDRQKVKHFFFRILCGFFIGISVIAPGVSGSVMAVMMGIYDQLINIVSNPFKNFKRNCFYLVPMGIGAVLSIAIFVQILNILFENLPIPGYLLFIGLIIGSLPMVFKEANQNGFKAHYIFGIIGSLAVAVTIGILASSNAVSGNDMNVPFLSLCGLIAGAGSMVPGMSISMILMMLGVYTPLLAVASGMVKSPSIEGITTLLPFVLCFAIGMVLFSRLTKFIFKKYHNFGYFMVFGFMIGSISFIINQLRELPQGLPQDSLMWILCIVFFAAGLGISFLFQVLGKKFNHEEIKYAQSDTEKSKQELTNR